MTGFVGSGEVLAALGGLVVGAGCETMGEDGVSISSGMIAGFSRATLTFSDWFPGKAILKES